MLGPELTLVPSVAYLNLIPSKAYFSSGSPIIISSAIARVWAPPITIIASLLLLATFSSSKSYSLSAPSIPASPLIIRSFWVRVPVLSKQQISILPPNGILNGSVQKICF